MDAKAGVGRDERRAHIERAARHAWHPIGVETDELLQGCQREAFIKRWDAQPRRRGIQASQVTLGTKQHHVVRRGAKCFQSVKDRLTIVENDRRRLQQKRPIGLDPGLMPARLCCIIHEQHVVGEHLTES